MKPILMNTDMVRAILAGRKTVTRRVVKPQPPGGVTQMSPGATPDGWCSSGKDVWVEIRAPYQPGDILWVRETWAKSMAGTFMYRADDTALLIDHWRPSIHMPREAARIFLKVTSVRAERLQKITPQQIDAEGCCEYAYDAKTGKPAPSGPSWFIILWGKTIKPADLPTYGWEANPWVWVIEFERIGKEKAER